MKTKVRGGCRGKRQRGGYFILSKTGVLLLILMLSVVCVKTYAQKRINLQLTNSSLLYVLDVLQEQSGFSFLFSSEDVRGVEGVTVNLKDVDLEEALKQVLKGTSIRYEINNGVVVFQKKIIPQRTAQLKNKEITGWVTDRKKIPIEGVNVVVKGRNIGTTTNKEGKFSLQFATLNDFVLEFSFLGMKKQEVKYVGRDTIRVMMEDEVHEMEEVTVVSTGYQKIDARKLTSAVTTVKAAEVVMPGLSTIDQMLEGYVPGMVFMSNSNTIGAVPRIRIRGTSTILGNQEPLWVVDGIVYSDPVNFDPEQLNDLDFVNLLGNAISGINPEDIDQIDVLKDASATAIYGARAANGVIVITTKKGKIGPPQVSYSFSGTFGRRPHYSDRSVNMMNSKERIAYSRELMEQHQTYGHINSWVGYEGAMHDYLTGKTTFEEMQSQVSYYEKLNTDWFKILTQNTFTNKHTVSVSGGSSVLRYYASAGLQDVQGYVKGENNKTYSANINLTANFKRFTMRFGMNASVQNRKYTPTELNVLNYAYNTSRAIPAYGEDGEPYYYYKFYSRGDADVSNRLGFNILNEMENSSQKYKTYATTLTASLDYKILESLKFGATLSYSTGSTNQELYYNEKTYRAGTLRGEGENVMGTANFDNLMPYGGELTETKTTKNSYTLRGQFSYNKDLGTDEKHNISIALGGELSSMEYQNLNQIYRGYMPDRGKGMANFDPNVYGGYYNWYYTTAAARGIHSEELTNIVSGYITASYDYDNRYMLNVNARADASNQFGSRSNEKVLPIWSFSGRWNAKKDVLPNVSWLSNLSLRASLGLQGNMLSSQSSKLIITRDGEVNANNEYLSTIYSFPNPDLKWEKTISTNFMLDFGFLKNRITGSVAYYHKKTKDAFLTKKISTINGRNSYVVNRGSIQNSGVELSLNFLAIDRTSQSDPNGFRWTIVPEFGETLNKLMNKVSGKTLKDEFTYKDFLNGRIEIPGKPLNSFYSYRFTGLSREDGRPTFYGMDEEQFRKQFEGMSKDEIYMTVMDYSGNRVPVFQGSLRNTFSYKRFTLAVNMVYSFGTKIRLLSLYPNVSASYGTIAPQPENNVRRELLKRWKNPGDENYTNIPGTLSGTAFTQTLAESTSINWWKDAAFRFADNIWQMYDNSDVRVVSGDYMRLQSLSLRYAFPPAWLKKFGVNTASVGFYTTNLFTLCSKKLKGQDPATQTGSSSSINMSNRPTFSLSFNVAF